MKKVYALQEKELKQVLWLVLVYVDGQKVDKVGEKVSVEADIEYKGEKLPYVSRGGFNLKKQ